MTEREMLELAAKAAGYNVEPYTWFAGTDEAHEGFRYDSEALMPSEYEWNPLTDDGDALRLAVKLRIKSRYHAVLGQGLAWTEGDLAEFAVNVEDVGRDERAATRLAIVRAAATIGAKSMPAQKGDE